MAALAAKADVSRWRLIEFELGSIQLRDEERSRIQEALRRYSQERIKCFAKIEATACSEP